MSNNTVKVLDHGFVRLRNLAGPTRRLCDSLAYDDPYFYDFDASDEDAPNAARMSFDATDGNRTAEQDHKLAEYLMKNKHTSPFEMVQVWLEMKLPIFVARQFVRHRTVRLNEVSGRYVTLPAEWYIPEVVGGKAPNAKQGQIDNLHIETQEDFKSSLHGQCKNAYQLYLHYMSIGVAPEHARMFLHLNHYTHWLWNQDLHNLMHFLALRDHSHAQIEAQAYAKAIDQLIRKHLPKTMELYDKYRKLP
jgi:thymidylate synthase (FAD)